MKILVTGAGGLLAHAVLAELADAGFETRALAHADLDVTRLDDFRAAVESFRPNWVFHLAAYTRVDDCEQERDRAYAVNAFGARNAALAARATGARLMAISSDYVFDGSARTPWREYDEARPLSVYGASKWAGEQAIREVGKRFIIVRTAWLFGPGGGNFVDAILKKAAAGESLRVVGDQRGSPTYSPDLARALRRLAERGEYGTYHVANAGEATWHELAEAAVRAAGRAVPVERIESAALARPARRPAYSVLDASWFTRTMGEGLPDWRDALERYLKARGEAR